LKREFGSDALSVLEFRGELTLVVPPESIVSVCRRLKEDEAYRFDFCIDVSAVDQMPRTPRFDVNYHLAASSDGRRIRVKAMLPGPDPAIESVTSVWSAANWLEREIYDLMGVVFLHHPDLRRIELPEEWEGHPHRRDYPVGKNPISFTPPPPGQPPGQ
jgi:NADH-quinone oxidoreductase subunit C